VSAAQESAPPPAPRIDRERLHRALAKARAALLAERGSHGHWEGELSSSALSTATAATALELWQRNARNQSAVGGLRSAVESGLQWLAEHQNADGGWGDTTLSFSNISTTALCWAAFGAVPGAEQRWPEVVRRAEGWLAEKCLVTSNQCSDPNTSGNPAPTENWKLNTEHSTAPSRPDGKPQTPNPKLETNQLISAIIARYGKDRTFSVPILTMCALAGRLGEGKDAWRRVIQLPFELAALPQKFFAALRLPVVSYALPALIAIGQVRHHHLPTRNPLLRVLRDRARAKTLRVLERIQPPNGGFLEATPLTSFVTMSLAGSGHAEHPVALRGVDFLLKSVRADGSWPIDTNLATWVTTLAVNALGPSIHEVMSAEERARILDWLLAQQYRTEHPYTGAAPGGWAWTDLPGGVPDADDTAGALLALKTLSSSRRKEAPSERGTRNAECGMGSQSLLTSAATGAVEPRVREAAIAGVKWLLALQNRDGGIPTFCRGWTNLPFDRSSPDITAHTLRAWLAWEGEIPTQLQNQTLLSTRTALGYLMQALEKDDSWLPLWFGSQHLPNDGNPVYGTSKGLLAVAIAARHPNSKSGITSFLYNSSVSWLVRHQFADGGWGRTNATNSSIEETALAVEALSGAPNSNEPQANSVLERGVTFLLRRVEDGTWTQPAPIGFYFAKLWYYERLYPMVFTVAALEAVARLEAAEK
jgi:squalene-hopene/tetraprenyl-beta-curcumene cyclase